jgi:DNA-binding transcriptional regulator YdaS (Cro superfamily)
MNTQDFVIRTGMRQVDIARAVGVHPVLIHLWSKGKRELPADRVLAVARATGWRVTPHELRPDLYPNPTDGLPVDHPLREPEQEAA